MSYYYTNIIKEIKELYTDYEFPHHIFNRGVSLYQNGAVSDVAIVNDRLVTATVQGTNKYHVEITDTGKYILNYRCTCESKRKCKHAVALVQYIKANYRNVEINHIIKDENIKPLDYILALFNELLDLSSSYRLTIEDTYLISKLINLITEKFISLLMDSDNEDNYDAFFLIFNKFINMKLFDDAVNEKVDAFINELYKLMIMGSNEFLKSWSNFLKSNELEDMFFYIDKAKELINSKEDAEGFKRFLDYTLNLVRSGKVYIYKLKTRNVIQYDYINKIIILTSNIINEFLEADDYYDYLEKNAVGLEEVEVKYISEMFKLNRQDRIISYVEKNKNTYSLGKIVYKGILLSKKLISIEDYKKDILSIFQVSCKVNDFLFIHKLTPVDIFEDMKTRLLNYAKKTSKYDYYEIEIYLDLDKGYNILKEAGIYEFNKHVIHFLPKYEEDIIPFYQQQLVDHFVKVKSMGIKFDNAMEAIKSLSKMTNGRYYVFSIYRMAMNSFDGFETSEALNSLFNYIENMYL